MRKRLAVTCVLAVLVLVPVVAGDSLRERLHALGERACAAVLDHGPLEGVDHAAAMAEAGLARDAYCGCVGEVFELHTSGPGDEDAEVFMTRLVGNAMTACLSGSDHADDVVDGDLELDAEDFAFDWSDVDMCEMAMRDEYPMPGFQSDAVLAQLQRTGQARGDLCICAARYFAAGGEPLQEALQSADNPAVVYGSTMAGAINTCLLD